MDNVYYEYDENDMRWELVGVAKAVAALLVFLVLLWAGSWLLKLLLFGLVESV